MNQQKMIVTLPMPPSYMRPRIITQYYISHYKSTSNNKIQCMSAHKK